MPLLSEYAKRKKIAYFFEGVRKDARILEIGCGDGWLGQYLRERGWNGYRGLDLAPPAEVVGDVRQWRELGLKPASFDVIVAFEVVEHVPCFQEIDALLAPDGRAFLTSPLPERDWICRWLEVAGMSQKRTSPHDHLVDFRAIPHLRLTELRIVGFLAQWGTFQSSRRAG